MTYNQNGGYQPMQMQQNAPANGCFDWDSSIEKESSFVLLPEGDYEFEILKFEKGRHAGSKKIPPCNKAIVTFRIFSAMGSCTVTENFLLHQDMEWKLSEFFAAIGMKKRGERVVMQWSPALIGKRGMCKLGVRSYRGDDGSDKQVNSIEKLYAAYDLPVSQQPQNTPPPAWQPMGNGGGYVPF